jgi:hypothetical protein
LVEFEFNFGKNDYDDDVDNDEYVGLCVMRGVACARIRATNVVDCSRSIDAQRRTPGAR